MRARRILTPGLAFGLILAGAAPAYAVPTAPVVENIMTTTGTLTADALTDEPFVLATLTGDFADAQAFAAVDGTAPITVDTWGFSAGSVLAVTACPSGVYVVETCSDPVETEFTPVDVTPTLTWPEDTTVGPEQAFDVAVADTGGGTLVARWNNDAVGILSATLDTESPTDLAAAYGEDGDGLVTVVRCSADHPAFCSSPGATSSPLTRRTTSAFSVDAVDQITQTHALAMPSLHTVLRGDYSLDYQFEKVGGGTEPGATGVTGTVPTDGTITSAIDVGNGLTDGDWDLVVDFSVTDPAFSADPLPAAQAKVRFSVDISGPQATLSTNRATIHPRISGLTAYPNTVTASATGDVSEIDAWVVRRAGEFDDLRTFPAGNSIVWNGRNGAGEVVPAGSYEIRTQDTLGNLGDAVATVQVTSKHIITGTFARTVLAGPTIVDRYVGRCSRLRRPSLRGWVGSLGFYANTRCANTSVRASLVSTVHGITVPAGYTYTSLRISAYGGAARSRSRSRAVLRYLTNTGQWRMEYLMRPRLGWQNAAVPAAPSAYVDKNRRVYWGVYTLAGHRYDVAKFKVQVKYRRIVD